MVRHPRYWAHLVKPRERMWKYHSFYALLWLKKMTCFLFFIFGKLRKCLPAWRCLRCGVGLHTAYAAAYAQGISACAYDMASCKVYISNLTWSWVRRFIFLPVFFYGGEKGFKLAMVTIFLSTIFFSFGLDHQPEWLYLHLQLFETSPFRRRLLGWNQTWLIPIQEHTKFISPPGFVWLSFWFSLAFASTRRWRLWKTWDGTTVGATSLDISVLRLLTNHSDFEGCSVICYRPRNDCVRSSAWRELTISFSSLQSVLSAWRSQASMLAVYSWWSKLTVAIVISGGASGIHEWDMTIADLTKEQVQVDEASGRRVDRPSLTCTLVSSPWFSVQFTGLVSGSLSCLCLFSTSRSSACFDGSDTWFSLGYSSPEMSISSLWQSFSLDAHPRMAPLCFRI